MRVWRIAHRRHGETAAQLLSGKGAAISGGRWNSEGRAVVYSSDSGALAALEILVNLKVAALLRQAYVKLDIEIAAELVETLPAGAVDLDDRAATRAFGDAWLDATRSAVLSVPSRVIAWERNLLLNPAHPDFSRCRPGEVTPFAVDPRLADLAEGSKAQAGRR